MVEFGRGKKAARGKINPRQPSGRVQLSFGPEAGRGAVRLCPGRAGVDSPVTRQFLWGKCRHPCLMLHGTRLRERRQPDTSTRFCHSRLPWLGWHLPRRRVCPCALCSRNRRARRPSTSFGSFVGGKRHNCSATRKEIGRKTLLGVAGEALLATATHQPAKRVPGWHDAVRFLPI
jgi:hypothetical protein